MNGVNKKIILKYFSAILFGIFICALLPEVMVWATEVDAVSMENRQENSDGSMEAGVEEAEYSFGERMEYEWGTNVTLNELFSSEFFYFEVGKWAVSEAVLELHMNASQLINKEVSYLTIYLDDVPIETIPVPVHRREGTIQSFSLPIDTLNLQEGHKITIEAYLRGQTTDACVDDSAISTWFNIYADSKITLQYEPLLTCENIADFYEKFGSIEALEKEQCMVIAGENASDSVLTAMAQVLSGIAGNARGDFEKIKTGVSNKEQVFKRTDYIIYMDDFQNLPDFIIHSMSEIQKKYAEESAVVCLLDYQDSKILLVTGNQAGAVENAGFLLSNHELIVTLTDRQYPINAQDDYKTDSYTWKEYIPLTQFGDQVKGLFEQSISFSIDCPTDRRIAASAQLSLDYRYAANLDFDKSLLTIYINGTPIGSRVLTKEGADGTTEIFAIPEDIDVVGSFMVEARFALYPKGDWCELTPEEIPWAYVAETSMMKCTTTEHTELFFEYLPFPFVKNGEFSEVRILLPTDWNETDFSAMAGIMLNFGRWLRSNAGELQVITVPDESTVANANIISIGIAAKNFIDTENDKLSGNRGLGKLDLSPYGDKLYGILTITGETESGVSKAMEFLGKNTNQWKLQGDLFYTDGTNITCRYIRTPDKKDNPPEVPLITAQSESNPLVTVCSVLVLVLLAAAMLLIKYKKKG